MTSEHNHERRCAYVLCDGPAPCTCEDIRTLRAQQAEIGRLKVSMASRNLRIEGLEAVLKRAREALAMATPILASHMAMTCNPGFGEEDFSDRIAHDRAEQAIANIDRMFDPR
jgi:hypothetical protein